MQDKIAQEVQEALTKSPEEITFETLQNEDSSPLNQPVIEKDIGGERPADDEKQKSWNVWKPEQEHKTIDELEPGRSGNTQTDFRSTVEANVEQEKAKEPLDAPEQEINGNGFDAEEDNDTITDNDFEVPLAQANQAADALLGMTNNVMAVGGGYFVSLMKLLRS
jgi:DNA mismatch repair ATPase MutL